MPTPLKWILPLLYLPLAIIWPVFGLDTDYGWSIVIAFWIPIVILAVVVLPRTSRTWRRAFWITCLLLVPVTIGFEYLSLWLDIWNFSQEHSRLWGPHLFGAPIEEFIFWFGATPLCLLTYLYYRTLIRGVRT